MGIDQYLWCCQRANQTSKNPNSGPQSGDTDSFRLSVVVEGWVTRWGRYENLQEMCPPQVGAGGTVIWGKNDIGGGHQGGEQIPQPPTPARDLRLSGEGWDSWQT